MKRILGAVLAGGRSRRFGTDKALADIDGRTMLQIVVDAIASQVDGIVICGRADGLADRPSGGLGPLAGINAAIHYGRSMGFDAVLSAPCDTPDLPPDLRDRLEAAVPSYVAACPVIGLWPCHLADIADAFLMGADRSMRAWGQHIGAVQIALPGPLPNINRQIDLTDFRFQRE